NGDSTLVDNDYFVNAAMKAVNDSRPAKSEIVRDGRMDSKIPVHRIQKEGENKGTPFSPEILELVDQEVENVEAKNRAGDNQEDPSETVDVKFLMEKKRRSSRSVPRPMSYAEPNDEFSNDVKPSFMKIKLQSMKRDRN
ncbi:hypothetical protein PENTCL1PPCAC_19795, partial [Pristionchus entomophagus]